MQGKLLWTFKPQELSNTVWAFATIGLQHEPLFRQVVAVAISKRQELSPQNSANILWAYAKLQVCRRSGLFPALLSASLGNMPQHKPQEISAIVWAAAREDYAACRRAEISRRFFDATAQMFTERLHEFPPQALANMFEAYAVIDANTPNFSEAMAKESVSRLHQFEPMALSNLLRGVALMAKRGKKESSAWHDRQCEALGVISAHIASRASELQEGDLAHIAHSLQILGNSAVEKVHHTAALAQAVEAEQSRRAVSPWGSGRRHGHGHGHGHWHGGQGCRAGQAACFATGPSPDLFSSGSTPQNELVTSRRLEEDMPTDAKDGPEDTDIGREHETDADKGPGGRCRGARRGEADANMAYEAWHGVAEDPGDWCTSWSGRDAATGGPYFSVASPWGACEAPPGPAPAAAGLPLPEQWRFPWPSPAGDQWGGVEPPGLLAFADPPAAWPQQLSHALPETPSCPLSTEAPPCLPSWGHQVGAAAPWNAGLPQAPKTWSSGAGAFEFEEEVALAGGSWTPRCIDVCCLIHVLEPAAGGLGEGAQDVWKPVDLREHLSTAIIGTGSTIIRLRYGVLDERVVIKRMSAGTASWPMGVATDPHMLAPCARITANPDGAVWEDLEEVGDCYMAYSHCQYGSLGEWILAHRAVGRFLTREQSSRVVCGIIRAAALLLSSGMGISSICADEVFIDFEGDPHVRLRHDRDLSASAGASRVITQGGDAAKWLSPEEAQGSAAAIWPSAAFRVGLVLYCLGAGTADPYPQKCGKLVFLDLKREASCGRPVRPDLGLYRGPASLRSLAEACLSPQPSMRPSMCQLLQALEAT